MFIDMSALLDEWETPILVIFHSSGNYEGGRWVPGEEKEGERLATVVPFSNDDLQRDENGTYTRQDVKVYARFPMPIGTEIIHKDKRYKIQEEKDYSTHSNVYVYFAKRVEKGDKGMG